MAEDMQHLMRVRLRKAVFKRLQVLAQEESQRTRQNVTVSDLVRVACVNHLLIHEAVTQLEHAAPEHLDAEPSVLVWDNPAG